MEIHEECFASTKKGGRRKYVRKAYETSKQLRQQTGRNIPQDHPERYTLAMIADLESKVNFVAPMLTGRRWLNTLKEMYVYFERRR